MGGFKILSLLNSAQGLLERSWITGVLPSEIIASYMMSQFLVMVMQVTITKLSQL